MTDAATLIPPTGLSILLPDSGLHASSGTRAAEPDADEGAPADVRGRFLAQSRRYLLEMPAPEPGPWLLAQPAEAVTRSRGARR